MGSGGRSKGLLGGIHHVEESVLVPLPLVQLGDGRRHRNHAVSVHQQEEGLVGVQLQTSPAGGRQGQDDEDLVEGQVAGDKVEKEKETRLYLMILMSSLMFTWSGTRNLVLSRMGSCFSPLYRSIIT